MHASGLTAVVETTVVVVDTRVVAVVVTVFLIVEVGRLRQWQAYSRVSHAHPRMGELGQSPLALFVGIGEMGSGQTELVTVVVAMLICSQRNDTRSKDHELTLSGFEPPSPREQWMLLYRQFRPRLLRHSASSL
ncbi:hypothetical protein IG631_21529 [Alternaria alternata]|nr:hypothetical protein IG631_21529 [Alternaria alternata]